MQLYTLKVIESDLSHGGLTLFSQHVHHEKFVSANLRLCGENAMPYIKSEELAIQFLNAILPVLEKKYGSGFKVEIEAFTMSMNSSVASRKIRKKAEDDSDLIEQRLIVNYFTPRRSPKFPPPGDVVP
ncbi:hypothetical protein FNU76_19080 [Chitinimonas arctica]|uniref:Uncharacterized protein n=1 Tax=Chitinimonas arctica TaxID=2594795 RepID=A0A516SJG4_9NEIS|nr:hypothetical protein [Chitinimonas arctica]QDQ28284.1 hypothetical protein FNU76_19080 [Chitinimonas arctica]